MPNQPSWLPLFPLNTVLFPGGILPLKVFEARYIDMVRHCMKTATPFGIVLIKSGQEVGQVALPEAVGCVTHITDWDMPTLGVLMLRTQGGERFRILETRTLADQRLEAHVQMLAPDKVIPISDIHVACAAALKTVIEELNAHNRTESAAGRAIDSPFSEPAQLDNAGWVANRWCEILPIPLTARQKLLELDDAGSRLAVVYRYLQEQHVL